MTSFRQRACFYEKIIDGADKNFMSFINIELFDRLIAFRIWVDTARYSSYVLY